MEYSYKKFYDGENYTRQIESLKDDDYYNLTKFVKENGYDNEPDVDNLINILQRFRIKLLSDNWENYYKYRCPKYYLSFTQFIDEINSKNFFVDKDPCYEWEKEFFEDGFDVTMWDILSCCKKYNIILSEKVKLMVCEACVCETCGFKKECIGYDCNECKNEMKYTGYQGICD